MAMTSEPPDTTTLRNAESRFQAMTAPHAEPLRTLLADGFLTLKRLHQLIPVTPDVATDVRIMSGALYARVTNDLRCAELLGATGYAAQALTLLATTIEATTLIVEQMEEPEKATEWVNHTHDPDRPGHRPWQGRVKRMLAFYEKLHAGVSLDGGHQKAAEESLDLVTQMYSLCCDYKHIDPSTQRNLNVVNDAPLTFGAGPDFSEYGQVQCLRALYVANWLATLLIAVYGRKLTTSDAEQYFSRKVRERFTTLEQHMNTILPAYEHLQGDGAESGA